MNDSPATRTLRAAVFAALTVPLAALGQVLVSGRPLPLGVLLLAGAGVFALGLALAGTQRRLRTVTAALLGVQLALGALLPLAQTACTPPAALPAGGAPGFEPLFCRGGPVGGFLLGHATTGASPVPAAVVLFLAAQLAAVLAAALWLHRADAALTGLRRSLTALRDLVREFLPAALGRLLLLALTRLAPGPPVRAPLPETSRVRPRSRRLAGPLVRRGPPVLAAAA
ncbi:hypothetical protein [Kitasatospora camelliae]|uniref:Uncharacterized protein n=1 Tax=Kitasatospora camelliae TaxID=3156397 RepID=A0AAU8JSN5_9ACTN